MHAIQGGWVGQTFALATSNDAGGKKSRMRRSKEERKTMVESFIKRYQKSNKGNFPSLNLTHKEVGGSFYTVREIVREIIQENRVLAPPKKFLDEQNRSEFTEQHALGSTPLEHQNDMSASGELHIATPILLNQSLTTNVELVSSSSELELNDGQVFNGLHKVTKKDEVCEEASINHLVPNHYPDTTIEVFNSGKQIPHHWNNEFENEKNVVESEGLEENTDSHKSFMISAVPVNEGSSESTVQSTQKVHDSPETQGHSDEQYLINNEQMVDKLNGAEKQAHMESVDKEILSKENVRGQDKEVSHVATSNASSVAEIFPVHADSRTVLDLEGKSHELHEAPESSKHVANIREKSAFNKSNLGAVNGKDEEKLEEVTWKLNHEHNDEKVVQNLHELSSKDSNLSTTVSPGPDNSDANDPRSKSSLHEEIKVSSSTTQQVVAKPTVESNSQNKNGLKKMDRINLETWKGASKKSHRPESNPVLALVKAFVSVLVKLWTQ